MNSLSRLLRALFFVGGLALPLCLLPTHAQLLKSPQASAKTKGAESLGAISFVAPPGWKRKATPDFVSFELTDSKRGAWAVLGVYRDQPGSGNAAQDFAAQWAQIVGAQFNVPVPNEIDTTQHPGGYDIKVGGTQVQSQAGPAVAILVVASGHGVAISALLLTNHNDYVPEMDKFLQGVKLDVPKPGSTPSTQRSAAPAQTAAGGSRPGELVGMWVSGSVGGPALYDRNTGAFVTHASGSGGQLELKANGQASWARMMENKIASCTNGFNSFRDGTWSASGNKISFNWTQGENQTVSCGKVKQSSFKPGTEEWTTRLYLFQGQPKLGLLAKPGAEQTWTFELHSR